MYNGWIEDGQLVNGTNGGASKLFISLPNKTVLQTIEGSFGIPLSFVSPVDSREIKAEETKIEEN